MRSVLSIFQWASSSASPAPAPGRQRAPAKLKLEFSKAADYGRLTNVLDPAVKNKIDPRSYVVKREDSALRPAIDRGAAGFLSDTQTKDVMCMAIAYAVGRSKNSHDYTEVGTTISRLPGFNSAQLVVAALALREWWNNPPKDFLVTEIDHSNKASIKTYTGYLGWRPITSNAVTAELDRLCNATIAPQDRGKPALWFHCDDSVITHQARILLTFMDQGGIVHRHSRKHVSVDFTALDAEGLTRTRLQALALGMTDRKKLALL